MNNNNLKIKNNLIVDGIIEIFEKESLNIKVIIELKRVLIKTIIIGIICLITTWRILNNRFSFISITFVTILICIYMIKKLEEISYKYAKNLGGRSNKKVRNLDIIIQNNRLNSRLIKESELKLLIKILRTNKLYSVECIEEIDKAIPKYEKKRIDSEVSNFLKDILSIYVIPIALGAISTYTSIKINATINEYIINIGTIIIFLLVISTIILILFLIHKIKYASITEYYTYNRLHRLISQILIIEKRKKLCR